MRRRKPPLVGLRSTSSPTASTRPVNISLDQHVRTERFDACARSASADENGRPARNGTPPGRATCGVDVQPDEVDDALVPGRRVQARRRLRAAASRSAASARRASAARNVPSARHLDLGAARLERLAQRRRCAAAAAVVTMMTGPASRVESTRAAGGVRSRRSKIDARQRPLAVGAARRQQRIVGENRCRRRRRSRRPRRARAARAGWPPPTSARVRRPGASAMQPSRLDRRLQDRRTAAARASA